MVCFCALSCQGRQSFNCNVAACVLCLFLTMSLPHDAVCRYNRAIIDKHVLPMYQLLLNVHVESSVGDEWIFYANQTSILS